MLDMVIANGEVVFPADKVQKVNVGVKDEKIAGFFEAESTPEAAKVIDTTGLHISGHLQPIPGGFRDRYQGGRSGWLYHPH
jgi:formylmethanofuran dehydrogenase subunit A